MISRRGFVIAGVAAGTGAALYFYDGERVPGGGDAGELMLDAGLGDAMNRLLLSLDSADPLGRAWLASQTPAPDLARLAAEVASILDTGAPDLAAAIAARVRRDFRQGRLCELDGWRLALTECQLAGLRVLAIDANPANAKILAARAAASDETQWRTGEIAPLKNWGPKKTLRGQPFNQQPDGHSGLWFQIEGAPARVKIMIDGEIAKTSVSTDVVTSGLFGETQERILATPGRYPIALVDPVERIKQPIGDLVVEAGPKASRPDSGGGFCPITRWGPQSTRVGVARNEQPDGAMGVWAFTDCLPPGATLRFGDDPLPLTRTKFGFTSKIALPLIGAPGKIPLVLEDPETGAALTVGTVTIE